MGDYLVIVYSCVIDGWWVYSCVIDGWLLGYSLFMCNWWVGDYYVIDGWLLGYSLLMCNWWVITWL